MSWKYRIAMFVLIVLTGLPLSGTVCAMMCDLPNTTARSQHDSSNHCGETTAPSTGVQILGDSAHECSTHDAGAQPLIMTGQRRGAVALATPLAVAIVHVPFKTPSRSGSTFEYSAPPGTAPPTLAPLVLRV